MRPTPSYTLTDELRLHPRDALDIHHRTISSLTQRSMQHFLDGHQVHPIAVLLLNEPTNDAAPFHLGFNVSVGNGSLIDEWSDDGVPCGAIRSRISTE
jgi:hypothetical protein